MTEPVRASEHETPEGVSEETIEGVGKLSEAFEYIERAKGRDGFKDHAVRMRVAVMKQHGCPDHVMCDRKIRVVSPVAPEQI